MSLVSIKEVTDLISEDIPAIGEMGIIFEIVSCSKFGRAQSLAFRAQSLGALKVWQSCLTVLLSVSVLFDGPFVRFIV